MKNVSKIKIFLLVGLLAFTSFTNLVQADVSPETFIIRNGDTVLWTGSVPLPSAGDINVLDKNGTSHSVNARSVLGILYSIDASVGSFNISNLEYYDSFGSFYIKCISDVSDVESCDYWQYAIDNATPWQSIDNAILSGGETVGIYFGFPRHLILDKTNISN